MTHPYFTAKARTVFAKACGDPANATPLAEWAEAAHSTGDTHRGVIVAETGRILAETRRVPGTASACGGTYVTEVADGLPTDRVLDTEVGIALGGLRRVAGPVIHVRYSEVCTGAGRLTSTGVA